MRKLPLILLLAGIFMMLASFVPATFAQAAGEATSPNNGEKFLAAGIAFGLAAFGAGYGVGQSGAAAIAAVTEKAEVRTTALIFVVLAEAIAIYGFAIAILILGQTG